tara:strand:- start:2305 stop:2466 length:162 start_codon:yes stop_codon:yes gene_type:complete
MASNVRFVDSLKVGQYKEEVASLVEYTNNSEAIDAGLTIGAFYRSGDFLKVVH